MSALGARGAEEGGKELADGRLHPRGAVFEDPRHREERMDVGEGGGERGAGVAGYGVEFTFGPVHNDEDTVDVAVDVGEEFGKLDGEAFEGFAEGVKRGDD